MLAGRNTYLQSLETSVSGPPVPSTGEGGQTTLHLPAVHCTGVSMPGEADLRPGQVGIL